MSLKIAEFKSPLMGSAELYEEKIVIENRNTTRGKLSSGKQNKTIFLNQLSEIIIKKAGLTAGHICFKTAVSTTSKKISKQDENTVFFGLQHNKNAELFKEAVEKQMAKNMSGQNHKQAFSNADEIAKFKTLLDQGIITPKEFEEKKKQLL